MSLKNESLKAWRKRNPIRYHYGRLKWRSKQRGLECTISYEEFETLCIATGYHLDTSIYGDSKTLDRIDPSKGYVSGNIQVISRVENTQKENDRRKGMEWKPIEGIDPF